MSTTLSRTPPLTTSSLTATEFAVVCLFSLLGLTLNAALLPLLSDEAINAMFSAIG